MDMFIKAVAGILITVVLCLTLAKQGRDISLLLSVFVCCAVIAVALTYLKPVIDFIRRLQTLGQLDGDMMEILLKAVGIGLLAEITGLMCADAGNASLGKGLQILASCVILWISIPMLESLLELIDNLLGAI